MQANVGRACLGVSRRTPYEPTLCDLGWLPHGARRDELRLRFFRRILLMDKSRLVRRLFDVRRKDLETDRPRVTPHYTGRVHGSTNRWCKETRALCERFDLLDYWDGTEEIPNHGTWSSIVESAVSRATWETWDSSMSNKPTLDRYRRLVQHVDPHLPDFTLPAAPWIPDPEKRLSNCAREATSLYSSLRSGCNSLRISTGRMEDLQREDRLCQACLSSGHSCVESEQHFCLECPSLQFDRSDMLRNIRQTSFQLEGQLPFDPDGIVGFTSAQTFWDDHWLGISPESQTDILLGGRTYPLESTIHTIPSSISDAVFETAIPALYNMSLARGRSLRSN
jgi:hypothetical protein